MATLTKQFDRFGRAAMNQSCLRSGPRPAPPALLSATSRRDKFLLDACMLPVAGNVNQGGLLGSDGASLGWTVDAFVDPIESDLNLYRYVADSPLASTDPFGLVGGVTLGEAQCCCMGMIWNWIDFARRAQKAYRTLGEEKVPSSGAPRYSTGPDLDQAVIAALRDQGFSVQSGGSTSIVGRKITLSKPPQGPCSPLYMAGFGVHENKHRAQYAQLQKDHPKDYLTEVIKANAWAKNEVEAYAAQIKYYNNAYWKLYDICASEEQKARDRELARYLPDLPYYNDGHTPFPSYPKLPPMPDIPGLSELPWEPPD